MPPEMTPDAKPPEPDLRALVARHGASSKLVRAICAGRGWRWTSQGAPAEWYAAWRAGLGDAVEAAIVAGGSG